MKILSVDDDPIFLDLMEVTLRQAGYIDVEFASSGEDALSKVREAETPFDCFLLDVQMPEMDGIELCRMIRRMPQARQTPILMVTAMSEKRYVDDAFAAGASDYVNKPIELGEIKARLGMVRKLLDQGRHNRALARQVREMEETQTGRFGFDDKLMLDEVEGLIDYVALENYLLKLGSMRMFINSAIGFHVENALEIFAYTRPQEFIDIMSDAASVIADGMLSKRVLISYAGAGNFVAIVRRHPPIDRAELELEIKARIDETMPFWQETGMIIPSIRVGKPVNHNFLSFSSASSILNKAVVAACRAPGITDEAVNNDTGMPLTG